MLASLSSLTEGGPQGHGQSADPSGGPLACGAGGGRTLNIAARSDPFCPPHPAPVRSCGRGVAALRRAILDGHQALDKGGGTSGGTWDVPLPPAWPDAHLAPCVPAGAEPRRGVGGVSAPGGWGDGAPSPGGLGPLDSLAAPGDDDAHPLWGV